MKKQAVASFLIAATVAGFGWVFHGTHFLYCLTQVCMFFALIFLLRIMFCDDNDPKKPPIAVGIFMGASFILDGIHEAIEDWSILTNNQMIFHYWHIAMGWMTIWLVLFLRSQAETLKHLPARTP